MSKITKVVYNASGEYAVMNLREMDIRREERQAARAEGMQIGLSKGLKQGLNQGIKQGEHEAKINAAKAMLVDGLDATKIAEYLDLPVEIINGACEADR